MAVTTAFTILGTVAIDGKAAEQALVNLTKAAQSMASASEKMARSAESAFNRADVAARNTVTSVVSLNTALKGLATGAFAVQMQSFAQRMIGATAQTQDFRRALTAVTGSAAEAEKVLKKVFQYAKETPYEAANLTEIAVKFASMKQPIEENITLAAKLAYIFKKDLSNAGDIVAQANAGVIDSLTRLKEQFGFTIEEARKYGAVIAGGSIVVGNKGDEANNRLMKALRNFVADREKGLGGNVFGGPQGIAAAISNVGDTAFQALAALGEKIAPDVLALSDALQKMLEWVKQLPDPILTLVARLAGFFAIVVPLAAALGPMSVVLGIFGKALGSSLLPLARLIGGLAGVTPASQAAGVAINGFTSATLGPAILAFAAISIGIELYIDHLRQLDKQTLESTKRLADFHKAAAGINPALRESGKSITTATVQDIENLNLSPEQLRKQGSQMRDFAKQKQERMDQEDKDFRGLPMIAQGLGQKQHDAEMQKLTEEKNKYEAAAVRYEGLAAKAAFEGLRNYLQNVLTKTSKTATPAREYHELGAEAEKDSQLRGINEMSRQTQESELKKQSEEAYRGIREQRMRKLRELGIKDEDAEGYVNKTKDLSKNKISPDEAGAIVGGQRDNPEQAKMALELRKQYLHVRKEGLDVSVQEIQHSQKLADIEHTNTPEKRIAALTAEQDLIKQAAAAKVISADEASQRLHQLDLQIKDETQKQKDSETALKADLKRLYGQDVAAFELELGKKTRAMREAGATEVQIAQFTAAEKARVYVEDKDKAIQAERDILAAKANIRNQQLSTKEASLQERLGQGEDVGEELRKTQQEKLKGTLGDIDADAGHRKQQLQNQLKRKDLGSAERRKLEAELGNLPASTQADKDAAVQSSESQQRAQQREEDKRKAEAALTGKELSQSQLQMKQTMLQDQLKQPGANADAIGKKMMDNLTSQLNLGKQILADKLAMDEVGKSEAEKANLQAKYKLDVLKLEQESLATARQITAEMDAQNQKSQKGGDGFSLGGMFTSYADAMAADKADSDSMRAKYNSMGGSRKGATEAARLGVDPNALKNTLEKTPSFLPDAKMVKEGTAHRELAGPGTPKADARNAEIARAGAAADAKGRPVLVKGAATLKVEVAYPDGTTVEGGKAEIPMDRAASENTQNDPLGGR